MIYFYNVNTFDTQEMGIHIITDIFLLPGNSRKQLSEMQIKEGDRCLKFNNIRDE